MKTGVKRYDSDAEYYFREGCYITELSNGEDDRAVSIARVRVEPGKATRWHSLKDIAERYVILSGAGRVELGHDRKYTVGENDVVIIPAGTPQRIINNGRGDLVFLAICSPRFEEPAYRDLEGTY